MITAKFNIEPFLKSMRAARARFAIAVVGAVRRATELAADKARATSLFKDKTGALRRSIKASYQGPYQGKVDAKARHAVWVERGNGPAGSFIYPKRAPMLVFHIGGQKIVAHRVRTTKPMPFMAEAARGTASRFEELCRDAAKNMFP